MLLVTGGQERGLHASERAVCKNLGPTSTRAARARRGSSPGQDQGRTAWNSPVEFTGLIGTLREREREREREPKKRKPRNAGGPYGPGSLTSSLNVKEEERECIK